MTASNAVRQSPFERYQRGTTRVYIDETQTWGVVLSCIRQGDFWDTRIAEWFPESPATPIRVATTTFRRYYTTQRSDEVLHEAAGEGLRTVHGQALLDCLKAYLRDHPEASRRDAATIVMVSLVKSDSPQEQDPMVVELIHTPQDRQTQLRLSHYGQAWLPGTIFVLIPEEV